MNYEIKGKIVAKPAAVTGVGQRGPWGKQTIVVEYLDGQYTKKIALDNTAKYEEFGKLQIGQEITAKFSVESREYNGKWYTNVSCFKWEVTGGAQSQSVAAPVETPAEEPAPGDLPF